MYGLELGECCQCEIVEILPTPIYIGVGNVFMDTHTTTQQEDGLMCLECMMESI